MNSILLTTLYDRRWFILGWTFGFAAFAALMVSFYPAMHQEGAFDALAENMPKAFEGLTGDLANLNDFPSYLASQLFDIRLPLVAGIMAIILGQSLSTNEEDRGELRTLLALPISRTKLLLQKWAALVIISGVTVLGLGAGIYMVLPTIDGELSFLMFLRLASMTWLLMIVYGTIAFSIGMITGSKGIATGISTLIIIGSFILSTFGQAVDWLESYEKLSLIYYFPAVDIVRSGIALTNVAILTGVTAITLLLAVVIFRRRDVR